jgi:hypothetical protein
MCIKITLSENKLPGLATIQQDENWGKLFFFRDRTDQAQERRIWQTIFVLEALNKKYETWQNVDAVDNFWIWVANSYR